MTAQQEFTKLALKQHPLSAAFPSMSDDDVQALSEDIAKHGQREKGVLLGGMVLDGWHRYRACYLVGAEFEAEEFEGEDPVSFVLSKNLHRRHLTASQKASAVVTATNWRPSGMQDSMAAAAAYMTEKEMAEAAEVSERTIRHAKEAERAGLGPEVREGKVSAERAAAVAKLSPAKQERAVKAIKEGRAPVLPKEKKGTDPLLQKAYDALQKEHAETKESLVEMTELAASAEAFRKKDEFKEMQNLRAELRAVKQRRGELMRENAELKKDLAYWKKQAKK